MNYSQDIFCSQYVVVSDFVQHLAYYRCIKGEIDKSGIQSDFWSITCNAHLEAATLDWCKVFGSDGPNPTHWKKTTGQTLAQAQDNFRQRVLSKTRLSRSEWEKYHQKMCSFRDKYVAHLDIGQVPSVPFYDKALQVAYAYDEWSRHQIKPDIITDPMLEQLYQKWSKETGLLVAQQFCTMKRPFN